MVFHFEFIVSWGYGFDFESTLIKGIVMITFISICSAIFYAQEPTDNKSTLV